MLFLSRGNELNSGKYLIAIPFWTLRSAKELAGREKAAAISFLSSDGTIGHEANDVTQAALPTCRR